MRRWIVGAFGLVCRRPWLALSVAAILLAAAISSLNLWAWYHFRAADAALRDDKPRLAHKHIAYCLQIWPRGPATHLLAARIECALGRYPEAEQYLAECVRLQHGPSEETQIEQTLLRAQSGELIEVEDVLWECINTHHPQSVRILEILSQVYVREARVGAAVTCLTIWLDREPTATRAWHWRGWAREYLQQPAKAAADYKKTLELDPQRWGARLRLARLLLQMNNPQSARSHLDELQREHGDDPDVQLLQAKVLRLEGDSEGAAQILDRLLEIHPRYFDAVFLYSQLFSERDPPQHDKAEQMLRRGLADKPTDFSGLHALYKCLENQGKGKEAAEIRARLDRLEADIRILEKLRFKGAGQTPTDPNELCEWGELLIRMGNEDAGLVWIYRALRIDPHHAPSLKAVIRFLESKGRIEQAELYRKQLRPAPYSSASKPAAGR